MWCKVNQAFTVVFFSWYCSCHSCFIYLYVYIYIFLKNTVFWSQKVTVCVRVKECVLHVSIFPLLYAWTACFRVFFYYDFNNLCICGMQVERMIKAKQETQHFGCRAETGWWWSLGIGRELRGDSKDPRTHGASQRSLKGIIQCLLGVNNPAQIDFSRYRKDT